MPIKARPNSSKNLVSAATLNAKVSGGKLVSDQWMISRGRDISDSERVVVVLVRARE